MAEKEAVAGSLAPAHPPAHAARFGAGGPWGPHVALLGVQVAFASQAVEAKIAMMDRASGGCGIDPYALAMFRMLAGAIFFRVVVAAGVGAGPTLPTRRDRVALAVLSLFGIVLNQTLFLLGLGKTTPFVAALLGACIPVLTLAFAVAARKEAFSVRAAAGLALAIGGVVSLTGLGRVDPGALLLALNSASYAAYVVFSRGLVLRLGAMRVMAHVFAWGALAFSPLGLPAAVRALPQLDLRAAGYLAYILAVPTIYAYFANAWALGRTSASVVTAYIYLQPLLAAILAWLQLGLVPSSRSLYAAPLILSGVALAAFRKARAVPPVAIAERALRAPASELRGP